MPKNRRTFKAQEKVAMLIKHLLEGQAISDICDQYRINRNLFYRRQKQFFENGASTFEHKDTRILTALKRHQQVPETQPLCTESA